jgi:quinol monooxygenase YgiN
MPQRQISVVARIQAKPGCEERVRQELLKLLTPTRSEIGCINYDMHQAIDDPATFLFYENWTSEEDLERHLAVPHLKAWFALAPTLLARPVEISRWYRVGQA